MTSRLFSSFRDESGSSSYTLLAQSVASGTPRDVLDIGCGDGALLEALAEVVPSAELVGIDLSPAELALARVRVPRSTLLEADCTQRFPFEDRRFDAVVSHLVLMLIGKIDATFAEIARVLAPKGTFAFLYDDIEHEEAGLYVELMRVGLAAAGLDVPVSFHASADARLYQRSELEAVLRAHGLALRDHRRIVTSDRLAPETVWSMIEASYPIGVLDKEERESAHIAVLARIGGEQTHVKMPLQLAVAERVA